jgi:hypothetical protein
MSDSYSRRIGFINQMIEEAKQDFPSLEVDDIEVQIYGGGSRNRTIGIEFAIDEASIPSSYKEVDGLEQRY